jgi:hypothetical protein
MTIWVHLSQVPEPVRLALSEAEKPFLDEDARLEAATLRALRQERLRARVSVLVRAAIEGGLTTRSAIQVVELHTGLSAGHVRRLFYRRNP